MKSLRNWVFESTSGVYIGMRLSDSTIEKIQKFIKDNGILNGVEPKDMHTTIIYSTKPDNVNLTGLCNAEGRFSKFSKFGENKNVLVMEIDSDVLENLHDHYMNSYDLSWDWPEYKPHITLSYDSDVDESKLIWLEDETEIQFENQYYEPLDPTWSESK